MDKKQEILEMLAENEHATWSSWMLYLFDVSIKNEDGTVTIPRWAVDGWARQANTEYADLSEDEKESDRKEVRHIADHLTAQEGESDPDIDMTVYWQGYYDGKEGKSDKQIAKQSIIEYASNQDFRLLYGNATLAKAIKDFVKEYIDWLDKENK